MTTRQLSLPARALLLLLALAAILGAGNQGPKAPLWVVYEGAQGPGKGKHIVLVSGDEEYRSEQALPQLAKILAQRHGFKCTVLFAIDPKDGTINPLVSNIPGLEALAKADLMVVFTRFRDLPDEQMKHLADYVASGRPIVGLRTATHAFNIKKGKKYAKFSYDNRGQEWPQGFGRQILGETWISHHGDHGSQSTRGLIAPGAKDHPVVRGIKDGDIWGPTDVYGVRLPLPGDSKVLVLGQVLVGMKPTDAPADHTKTRKGKPRKQNDPMMPLAWVKTYKSESGKTGRVFTTTMGASQDLLNAGVRRLLVNACYWAVGLEDRIPARADVDLVGKYQPWAFGFGPFKQKPGDEPPWARHARGGFQKGVRPADLALTPKKVE